MANKRISDLPVETNVETNDLLAIVDVSDTTGGSAGTTKHAIVEKVLRAQTRVFQTIAHTVRNNSVVYLAINGTTGSTAITNKKVHYIAPLDNGTVKSIKVECGDTAAAGVTVVGVHKNENTTQTEGVTVDMDTAGAVFTFTFSTNTFTTDDILSFSFNPTTNCGEITAIVEFEYNN